MALTPQDLIGRPLDAEELQRIEALEREIDDALTREYRGEAVITVTSTDPDLPSHRVQQEIIRRFTVPDDPNRGWSRLEFKQEQLRGWWITLHR